VVWKVADAKQHFSEVLRRAADEPQMIYNRDRPVAAVIDADSAREFLAWRSAKQRAPLAEALAQLARICAEEDYALEVPRRDRTRLVSTVVSPVVRRRDSVTSQPHRR
jgi:prevent-host-death family protein